MSTSKKKNIVLITTWFEPLESVAVNRMSAFAKYFDYEKYNLDIVTVGNEHATGSVKENNYQVHRIYVKEPLKINFKSGESKIKHKAKVAIRKLILAVRGDEHKRWIKLAKAKLNELYQDKKIDLIISSFSPAAPHLVALDFCKKNKVKWIVDMRDEMSLNPQNSSVQKGFYESIEKEINQYANGLISVSAPIVNYFKNLLPNIKYFEEVRNGYDHTLSFDDYNFNEVLTFLHAGSFYGTRKPDTFLKAMLELEKEGKLDFDWKFICAGAAKNFDIPNQIQTHVEIMARLSQQESLELMRNADVNVMIQPPTGRHGVYTGKIFDYLSVSKPILAIVDTNDVAAELISELNAGYSVEFDDISAIKSTILQLVSNWKNKIALQMNHSEIPKLHRKFQVQKLNKLIDKILNEN